jgi:hypothetical protein
MPKSKNRPKRNSFRPKLPQAGDEYPSNALSARLAASKVAKPNLPPPPAAKPDLPPPAISTGLKQSSRFGTGTKVAGGVLLGTAAIGGGYAIHRHTQKKKELAMSKSLVNPFEEVVVFGKAYRVALPVPSSTGISAMVPTGRHISHKNKLHIVHGGGPKITRQQLQIYHGGKSADFGKADKQPKASGGRMASGTLFPGIHGAVAGRKGRKWHAAGNELGGRAVGITPGLAASAIAARHGSIQGLTAGNALTTGGGFAGSAYGTHRAQSKGHYKSQAAKSDTAVRRRIPNSNIPDGSSRGSRIA